MAHLFEPLPLRGVTLKNRIAVSPMCEYSSEDGFAADWHLVHLGSRAVGGAALVFTEAAAVSAVGRISPHDLGIYRNEHVAMLRRITEFITAHGSVPGIQLAHAGRKASTARPWEGNAPVPKADGGWEAVAPSALAFGDYPVPRELTVDEIATVADDFAAAARRALDAGFRIIEVHAAHGYLLHEFFSPLSNGRTDAYGGSFENRTRIAHDVVRAIRAVTPEDVPLLVRISATDWADGGWTLEESVRLARELREIGVDLIDASSGGLTSRQRITIGPGYQVPFAARIRAEAGIPTGAVGLITDAHQADDIICSGQADLVLLARELLRDPYWPLHAAYALGAEVAWPPQYERAKPHAARGS
ncbi:MAG: NADH:flavin oxidoreductase/NADH oxidase [Candidatus Eremiobacteraeota bacterium]|nr:NADH:flavin oxidoreductase/NADH oxidase [Candidatus Eremiobacteraeota bacterium]MBC5803225.1 NADH:flavin oxidoreductase/NADH oxidase [Candidatus Eremiobacteraeota bacterium]MBC5823009.1 NADH:flavin oxidoreductase/NADH oxidase [Candidatus Eremiobacteraeota bacterium]